jgi:uncharacterized protein (TIGR02246 family)
MERFWRHPHLGVWIAAAVETGFSASFNWRMAVRPPRASAVISFKRKSMRSPLESRIGKCFAMLCLISGMPLQAVEASETGGETAAVRSASRSYVDAVARGDSETLLRAWTNEGDYVDASGRRHRAREFIRTSAARPGAAKMNRRAEKHESSLRFIAPGVAIEDGAYDAGTSGEGQASTGRFTAVWVKRDGRWLLDSLREAVSATSPMSERLRPLEWLLGEWVGVADDSAILVSARVSDRGTYIIRDFAVLGDAVEATATERIGWDQESGGFKSWTFDSQDGRGEGTWKRDGDGWIVETREVMGDGSQALTTAKVSLGDGRHFLWNVTQSKVGDESLPVRRIKFQRAPEDQ